MTVLNQIRTLLKMEIKLEQMELDNGTVIEAESFEAGSEVFIVNEDERVPLPVGEYGLADGVLVVVDEGVIGEIKPKGEPEVEPEEEEMETEKEVKKVTESVTTFFSEEQKTELAAMIKEAVDGLRTELTKVEEVEEKPTEEIEVKAEEVEASKVEPIKHSPEKEVESKHKFKFEFKNNRSNTKDRIYNKLFK